MARKSKLQRLADSKTALALWIDNGHEEEKPALFIAQMIEKLESGKYPSPAQREWLDKLATEGVAAFPITHNQDRLDEIDAAINTRAMHNLVTLRDFRWKLKRGWKLSEKQEAFLASLLVQAKELRDHGLRPLSDEDKFIVESLMKHWTGRSGTMNDYYGYNQGKGIFVSEAKDFYSLYGTMTYRHVQGLRNMFKGVTKSLSDKRFPVGSLVSALGRNGIVMSEVYINDAGSVTVDVLASGKLKEVFYSDIRKRLIKTELDYIYFWDEED